MKFKNIILCNNTLSIFAGSETATYTMAIELKRRGHNVTAFSFILGELAEKLKKEGIEVVDNLDLRKNDFDLAICNHFDQTNYVKAKCPNVPIINTIHGIIGYPEEPVGYAEATVSVSEEVQKLVKEKYGIESTVIRNGIDLERFKETRPRNDKIRNIIASSSYYNQNSEIFVLLHDSARIINSELNLVGKDFAWVWEMEEVYNQADLVITLGRGCIEAMACNKPVICLGHWGVNQLLSSDGLINKDNYSEIRENNFSSRRFRQEFELKDIVEELSKYDPTTNYRKIVEKEHDIKNTVNQYLALIK